MPTFRTLANIALGYGAKPANSASGRYRTPTTTIAFGSHPLQALDFHATPRPVGALEPSPLLVFVHGGAWQFGDKTRRLKDMKAPFAHAEGWHFAALNFRLVPEVNAGEMARDVAAGLAALFAQASALGIDRQKVVLMGHSSGAHLTALVAADRSYLAEHGLCPGNLAGLIVNDGAAYDARHPSTGSRFLTRRLIDPAFIRADMAQFSPVAHLASNTPLPPFLILHAQRRFARMQAELLEQALRQAGAASVRHGFAGRSPLAHMQLSRQFGRAGFGPTEVARMWLRARYAARVE